MWQEKPKLIHFGAILSAACFILWLQVRPYGVLFTLILTFWIYKTKCPNLTIVPPLTISRKFETTYKRLIELRQEQPRLCCIIISAGLVALAVLGHIVSGSSIVVFGLMVATLIFSRHKITIVKDEKYVDVPDPDPIINTIPITTTATITTTTTTEYDELLPDIDNSNVFLLENAGEKAVLLTSPNDDENEDVEIPTELLIPDQLPDIGDDNDSNSEEEFFRFHGPAVAGTKDGQDIEFKSGYFQNSSSSDDDSITKGLNFRNLSPDLDFLDGSKSRQQSKSPDAKVRVPLDEKTSSGAGALNVPALVTGLVNWGAENLVKVKLTQAVQQQLGGKKQQQQQQQHHNRLASDSSDDSEFEILNTDELNQS